MIKRRNTVLAVLCFFLFSSNSEVHGFILPGPTNTKTLREFPGGLFCNGVEVGGKSQGAILPQISVLPEVGSRFCEKGRVIYKTEMILTMTFPSFSGMAIDLAAQKKEAIILEIEKALTQFFIDSSDLNAPSENGESCLGDKKENVVVIARDFSEKVSQPSWNVFFALDEEGRILSVDLKYGGFIGTPLPLYAEKPRVYTLEGLDEIAPLEFKPDNRYQYWASKPFQRGKTFFSVYFKDLKELRDKYVLVGNASEAPSQLLADHQSRWTEFIVKSTKVTKQVFQDKVRFFVGLDLGDMCNQMVEKNELKEK